MRFCKTGKSYHARLCDRQTKNAPLGLVAFPFWPRSKCAAPVIGAPWRLAPLATGRRAHRGSLTATLPVPARLLLLERRRRCRGAADGAATDESDEGRGGAPTAQPRKAPPLAGGGASAAQQRSAVGGKSFANAAARVAAAASLPVAPELAAAAVTARTTAVTAVAAIATLEPIPPFSKCAILLVYVAQSTSHRGKSHVGFLFSVSMGLYTPQNTKMTSLF